MKHPVISKDEARRLLPPGACKRCVYWARCFPLRPPLSGCPRCTSGKYAYSKTFDHLIYSTIGRLP